MYISSLISTDIINSLTYFSYIFPIDPVFKGHMDRYNIYNSEQQMF